MVVSTIFQQINIQNQKSFTNKCEAFLLHLKKPGYSSTNYE